MYRIEARELWETAKTNAKRNIEQGNTWPQQLVHDYQDNPIGLISGLGPVGVEVKALGKAVGLNLTVRAVEKAVEKYEVGLANDLKKRSMKGDNLDIHHAVQQHPASQIIPDYDPLTAPTIALPKNEHALIQNLKGEATLKPRSQLALDIKNLRENTGAPNSKLVELINLNKSTYPNSFIKPPRPPKVP